MTIANPPIGFAASAGNGSVSLTWSASSGATSYNVYEGTTSSGEGAQPVQSGVSGASVTIGGLTNGKKYYFTVAAVDAGGVSPVSAEASATPAAPKGGGGAIDWLALAGLTALLGVKQARNRQSPRSRADRQLSKNPIFTPASCTTSLSLRRRA